MDTAVIENMTSRRTTVMTSSSMIIVQPAIDAYCPMNRRLQDGNLCFNCPHFRRQRIDRQNKVLVIDCAYEINCAKDRQIAPLPSEARPRPRSTPAV
jgi:hypothetical protein